MTFNTFFVHWAHYLTIIYRNDCNKGAAAIQFKSWSTRSRSTKGWRNLIKRIKWNHLFVYHVRNEIAVDAIKIDLIFFCPFVWAQWSAHSLYHQCQRQHLLLWATIIFFRVQFTGIESMLRRCCCAVHIILNKKSISTIIRLLFVLIEQ